MLGCTDSAACNYNPTATDEDGTCIVPIGCETCQDGNIVDNDAVVTYVCAFSAGEGTGALTEAGIFNASSSGTMLCRTEFNVVNKGASDSMTITWTVTVS